MHASTSLPTDNTIQVDVPSTPPEAHQRADVKAEFQTLLIEALTVPGVMNAAYRAFHSYSIGNQMLAAWQLRARGLGITPLASFKAWKEKGRIVKKGQKAISLMLPVTVKRKASEETSESVDGEAGEGGSFSVFKLRPNWFSLEQTEGEDFTPELKNPQWDATTALATLGVSEEDFSMLNGNIMGYATGQRIAINPLNPLKHKTRFHELAHVVLGHTADAEMSDAAELSRAICEVEAESVAFILCTLLELPGQAESRSYVQQWLGCATLAEKNERRIFRAADTIMKAGQPVGA